MEGKAGATHNIGVGPGATTDAVGGKTGGASTVVTAARACLGSPNSLRDTEGHSFSRPVSNLTSHLFSPLASKIIPSSHCHFCLLIWLPLGLQADSKNGP